ncbi:MAG: hypothetical protein NTY01_07425, partial [Verrucomicrobia bacterium]|nr:hypothetical protein [Verrucomicrobiota bacterium]
CAHGATDHALMVAVGLDIECSFDACPLAAKFWIGADGKFVLGILGLRSDKVLVGALLNMEFMVGHGSADVFVRRFRQQVYEKTLPGVQAFSLFQNSKAILQHILDIKRPQRWRDEHPVIKRSKLSNRHVIEILDGRMVTPQNSLGPFGPVKSAGLQFLKIEIERFCHGLLTLVKALKMELKEQFPAGKQ